MTKPKSRKEREWRTRKNANNPHGHVKSLEQIADEVTRNESKGK